MNSPDPTTHDETASGNPRRGNGRIRLILALGAVALLIFWFYPMLFTEEVSPEIPQEEIDPIIRAQIEAARLPEEESVESAPVEIESKPDTIDIQTAKIEMPQTLPPPTPDLEEGEAARILIASIRNGRENLELDQLGQRADSFQQEGKTTDAYLLYFFAARQGHADSALILGKMNDPATFDADNEVLEQPDPTQAFKWYSMAAGNGLSEAQTRLATLHNTIEQAAANGDPQAQRLLLNWQ
ncbi:MAG: sel1 repeat family protein [gamma proteobacterium endosymbiont of Lamellibrachia anaximandri]|nr:sel1 repeat family protein [gamma proteobacterium endosymbiont of Lamellibrachia anaximandri]MBL3617653.1 sel1 repeat family protein [gamma proteobacterium endosymbiont of Lamellibrachia anaximandri]